MPKLCFIKKLTGYEGHWNSYVSVIGNVKIAGIHAPRVKTDAVMMLQEANATVALTKITQ